MKVNSRKIFLLLMDIILISISVYIALILRFDGEIPVEYINIFMFSIFPIVMLNLIVFYIFHLYSSLWKHASIDEMMQVFFATALGTVASYLYCLLFHTMLPRSVYIIAWMLIFLFVGGSRMIYRILLRLASINARNTNNRKRIMVIGAGETGSLLIRELKTHQELKSVPVVVIDDNVLKQNSHIHGVPVKGGRDKIIELAKQYQVDEIIIAIPSASRKQMKKLVDICIKTKCSLKTMPGLHEMIDEEPSIKKIRDINIEDLLGREEIQLSIEEISGYLTDEVVLVTGGGGSIGSELCRQIARFNPKKLIVLDIYENNAYELQNELNYLYKNKLNLEVIIASVRDKGRMDSIFNTYRPGVVFHAAAHKHVPLMEANPTEAIKNNVFGTLNVAECADKYNTKKFVLISTDKAVNPTNIMGASKRVAEMIIQNMDKTSETEFVAVRFGNVLGSNGSVIPLFKKQIAHGGPITVTHPEITRFFMTIPEAAQLVIQAGSIAKGGEIFILDMGQAVKIIDLARDMIRLSGLEPDVDIKIEFTGLRPGEKLYEELLMAEEGLTATQHEKIFISKPIDMDHNALVKEIQSLKAMIIGNREDISGHIERLVPTYLKTS